ncbi:MAG: zf-HC2 domain-containing protein [Actinobacteria bacterium]|nr:zf-HC2 domain-containing protein [Actinomycetota bacterium]
MKEHCKQVLEKAYLYMDSEVLSADDRMLIRTHLEECKPCYERYGLEAQATSMISRLRGHDPCPDALRSSIKELLRRL